VILLEIFEEEGPGGLPCEQLPGYGGGGGVLRVATERWSSGGDDRDLADVMSNSMAGLRAVARGG